MNDVVIDIAEDFTPFPAGRHREDGRFSGQAFREDLLLEPISTGTNVTVKLDGAMGYGSSFLEEAFGGLVREHGISVDTIKSLITLQTEDQYLREEILEYILEAAQSEFPELAVG